MDKENSHDKPKPYTKAFGFEQATQYQIVDQASSFSLAQQKDEVEDSQKEVAKAKNELKAREVFSELDKQSLAAEKKEKE